LKEIDPSRLELVLHPDPVLRRTAARVERFDGMLVKIAARMLDLMRQHKGIGLAAPQVGLSLRLFVFNVTGEPGDDCVCVNPELSELAGDVEGEEGCLSLPDVTVQMHRAATCLLNAQDLTGKTFERSGTELAARCWQHEMDHLNGKLIIDNMSEADKIANRRALKQLEGKPKKSAAR
jgi:peptide deformylase